MNDNQPAQPPMNGNDDLAKTLNAGLQFEETPMPGAASTPTPPPMTTPFKPADTSAADDEDNMKMPSLDPEAGKVDDQGLGAPTMSTTPPADEPKNDVQDSPATSTPEESTVADEPKEEDAKPKDLPKPEHHSKQHDKPAKHGDLDGLKASALEALRPLVGKLKLEPKERFDTLLLLIRSTDDHTLLNEAHDAAKDIQDDTQRAQALLDVIKEIDYFNSKR